MKIKIIIISLFCTVIITGILFLGKQGIRLTKKIPFISFIAYDVIEPDYEFEPVVEGNEVIHDYIIKNNGDNPISIIKVRPG